MTFIEDIEPYIGRINLALDKKCAISKEYVKLINDVYVNHIDDKTPVNLNCNSCIRKMLQVLQIEYNKTEQPKGVKMTFPKQVDYNSMKWAEFRKYCKELGITNISKKNRDELTKELSKL